MAYGLFDDDEKIKMNESFNSLGIPTSTDIDISSKSNTDDAEAQKKALEDLISRQNEEEQKIRDDYDSLGSRANRFLQVFGAGLRGENTSTVAKDLRDNLNTRLSNVRSKYKDDRDAAFTRYKDTLDRKNALDKAEYQKERDRITDEQFKEKMASLKDQFDRQMKFNYDQLNANRDAAQKKIDQAQKDQITAENLQAQEKADIEKDISKMLSTLNPKDILWTRGSEEISAAAINDLNLRIAKNKYGKEGKEAVDFINNNPNLFLSDKDSKEVIRGKVGIIGYNLPKETLTVEEDEKVKLWNDIKDLAGTEDKAKEYIKKYGSAKKAKEVLMQEQDEMKKKQFDRVKTNLATIQGSKW